MAKPKKCKICGAEYQAFKMGQKVCGVACSIEYAKQAQKKEYKQRTRELKSKARENDRAWWLKAAQTACNAYIRERDKLEPCISCGRFHNGQVDAGHYRSAGAHPELRFHPFNISGQCSPCNRHKSGNITEYRINLKDKIGEKSLEWLDGYHEPCKWTIEDLKEIKAYYVEQLKILQSKDSFERWISPFSE